jgi:hypothetical protein
MGDRRLATFGAATGAAFAVLELLAGFIYPQQPRVDGPPSATVAWAHAHKVALQTGMIFGLLAAGLLVWFAGYLFTRIGAGGAGGGTVAPMVLGGGVAAAVVVAVAAVPIALLAFMVGQTPGIPDPTVVRLLGDLNTVLFAASATMTGVFLVAIGVAILRAEMGAPRWLGWLSLLAAAFNAVTVWEVITFTTYHGKWWNIVAFGAYIGFVVVMASLSVTMLRRRSDDPAVVMAGT